MIQLFELKKVTESGEELVPHGKPYWESPDIQLTLQDMALGTSKYQLYRLYNVMSPEYFENISAVEIRFDLSEAFTIFKEFRYDTPYETSLRKFIKLYIKIGSINSDFISGGEIEISSEYHANRDSSVIGLILVKNDAIYNALTNNPIISNNYVVVPFMPSPGDYLSILIGLRIPSKFEEDFLGKAGGFPVKQGEFKSPYKYSTFFYNVGELQKSYGVADTQAKRLYTSTVGPVPFDSVEVSNTEQSWDLEKLLTERLVQRGVYLISGNWEFSSSIKNSPALYPQDGSYLDPANPVSYQNQGLPNTASVVVPGGPTATPSSNSRPIAKFLMQLASFVGDLAIGYRRPSEMPEVEYNDYFSKVLNVALNFQNSLNSALFTANKLELFDSFTGTYNSTIPETQVGLNQLTAEVVTRFLNALLQLDEVSGTSISVPTYVPQECLEQFFSRVESPSASCTDFENNIQFSVKAATPNEWIHQIDIQSIETLIVLWYLYNALKNNPNLSDTERTDFLNEFTPAINILKYFAYWINQSLGMKFSVINKTAQTGTSLEFLNGNIEDLYKVGIVLDFADQVLELDRTGQEHFWHYYNKFLFHKGVYTAIPIKLLNDNPIVEDLEDNISYSLENFDAYKASILAILSAMSLKQSEKLMSLKLSTKALA